MKSPLKPIILIFLALILLSCHSAAYPAVNKKAIQMLTQATQLLCNNKYDEAIEKCNKILAAEPKCSGAYYIRGFAHRYKGEYDLSILDFTETLRIDPKYAAAYYGRAIAYAYKQMYRESLSDFSSAIRLDPKYTDAYLNRARVYYDMEEYDRAWEDVHKAEALGVETDLLYKGFVRKLQEASGRSQ